MSFNQPPPNPYGQQPPPPGPPPGYGYPQQGGVPPQQNPYAQPPGPQGPNPYAQQQPGPQGPNPYAQPPGAPNPYGQQPGWGGQVPPPPPGKSNTGKIIGIVAAIVVLAAVGIGVAVTAGGGSGSSSAKGGSGGSGGAGASDGVKYKLTVPQTVAGTYTLEAGQGQTTSPSDTERIPGIDNPTAVSGNYRDSSQKILVFAGDYGTISDPAATVDATFNAIKTKKSSTGGSVDFVGDAQEEHPSGFDGTVMKCQQVKMNGVIPGTICVWGDSSTVAEVVMADPKTAMTGGGTAPDIGTTADITAKVRQAARVQE